jgi:sigma-B regulation protein RsbU (phosphoserine phosphatase)
MLVKKDGEEFRADSSLVERTSSLLAGLDAAAMALVVQHLRRVVLPAGHVVFEDNAPGKTLYIIESGRVQVSKTLENGQEHVFAELGEGEFFGEMALLEEKPRSARVSTLTPANLLAMPRDTFNTLIERHPAVAANFLKVISARLRQRNHIQEILLREKQALVEELATKNVALERALAELRTAMETVAEHERVKRDLEIAREIQRQMLPTVFPQIPGLELYATTVPSRWVGGDFYDAVCVGPQTLGLLLGDVSGKGIPAAMQMAQLMGEFRASVSHRADPEGVMQVLNELLCQRNVQWTSFVTVQYVVLDMVQQQAHFICAGHPPMILCHADGQLEHLGEVSNVPLGIDETFTYRQEMRQLSPGDRLLLYSDGAYELRDTQGAMLGLSELGNIFAAAPADPETAIRTIQTRLAAFGETHSPHDDTTFLCARIVEQ